MWQVIANAILNKNGSPAWKKISGIISLANNAYGNQNSAKSTNLFGG